MSFKNFLYQNIFLDLFYLKDTVTEEGEDAYREKEGGHREIFHTLGHSPDACSGQGRKAGTVLKSPFWLEGKPSHLSGHLLPPGASGRSLCEAGGARTGTEHSSLGCCATTPIPQNIFNHTLFFSQRF